MQYCSRVQLMASYSADRMDGCAIVQRLRLCPFSISFKSQQSQSLCFWLVHWPDEHLDGWGYYQVYRSSTFTSPPPHYCATALIYLP